MHSEVLVGLVMTHGLRSVHLEIARVDIVPLQHHFEDFRVVHCSFFHELNALVLNSDGVIDVVVKLDLDLVLELAILFEEVFVLDGVCEVLSVLGDQVNLAVAGPRVPPVAHGVLRPKAHVLASAQQQKSVDLLVKALPVHRVRQPGERVGSIEEGEGNLPGPEEGVDEEDVPGEGHEAVVEAVRVLEVNGRVLDVVARVQKQFSLSVEFHRLGWLVHSVCPFQILLSTLSQFRLSCVNHFVQVVDLTE